MGKTMRSYLCSTLTGFAICLDVCHRLSWLCSSLLKVLSVLVLNCNEFLGARNIRFLELILQLNIRTSSSICNSIGLTILKSCRWGRWLRMRMRLDGYIETWSAIDAEPKRRRNSTIESEMRIVWGCDLKVEIRSFIRRNMMQPESIAVTFADLHFVSSCSSKL